MMWGYYDGWSWLWLGSMMLLFWGAIVALAVWLIRSFSTSRDDRDPAVETLRRRFAAGEISQEEFERTRKALQS